MITHIVLIKFSSGSTPEEKKAWRDAVVALKSKVSQVKDIRFGNKVHASEMVKKLDGGYDDGVVMTFDNMEDLQTYAASEPHSAYLTATAKQTGEKLIYDIES